MDDGWSAVVVSANNKDRQVKSGEISQIPKFPN